MEKGENKHKAETIQVIAQHFMRGFRIAGLAAILSLVLAGKVHATYLHSDGAGDYLDRGWYYLLDYGQYSYLDKGQYNLRGELGVGGQQVPISDYVVWSRYFNTGDYIDRVRYYYLDKGQYYYLDRGQYNLLGGLGYTFGRPSYQTWYDWGYYQSVSISATPEPSTILYLGLGIFGILALKRY